MLFFSYFSYFLNKFNVKIDKCELPTFYWLPKLHKRPYKLHFISNSSHCSTTVLSKHITSALTAVKDHVLKYSETAFSNSKRKRRRTDPVLWQNPLYQQKIRKPKDNTQTPPKTSITQRLRTDLGRSVGVTSHPTGVVKPVYGYPTFPLTAKAV